MARRLICRADKTCVSPAAASTFSNYYALTLLNQICNYLSIFLYNCPQGYLNDQVFSAFTVLVASFAMRCSFRFEIGTVAKIKKR